MPQPRGFYDRTETPEEIEEATTRLVKVRDHLAQLQPPAVPLVGSMLAAEDQLTAREPLSTLVRATRNQAVDALEMMMDATFHEDRELMWTRPMAPYALLRMSVEALGIGMWLVQNNRKTERVMRGLRLSYQQEWDSKAFALLLADHDERAAIEESHSRVVDRLLELKNALPSNRQKELTGLPNYTDILRSVSPSARPGQPHEVDSPLLIWKLCSSILHGNTNLLRGISDLEQLDDWGSGAAEFRITPKWGMISSCLLVCIRELRHLDARGEYLGTRDYAGRPV